MLAKRDFLERLLTETEQAHHNAPQHDGTWQRWYAEYIERRLAELQASKLTRTWQQSAKGDFVIRLKPGTPHCGYTTAPYAIAASFRYDLSLTWDQSALDTNGFLLDNTWFAGYFGYFTDTLLSVSCERLAQLIADDIWRECGTRGLLRCEVRISALPDVWVTVVCEYREEK